MFRITLSTAASSVSVLTNAIEAAKFVGSYDYTMSYGEVCHAISSLKKGESVRFGRGKVVLITVARM